MAGIPQSPGRPVQAKKPAHVPKVARPAQRKPKTVEPKPEVVTTAPRAYFLIGENKKLAGDVAEHEWGWKPNKSGWTTPHGDVRFLADIAAVKQALAKLPGSIGIFEGYRWYATIAPHLLNALVADGSVIKMPLPEPV